MSVAAAGQRLQPCLFGFRRYLLPDRASERSAVPSSNSLDHPVVAADLSFEELVKLNHDVKPDMLVEGQTIVLPAGKLSARDKEILQGIGPGTYRTYPVRAGETIEDIISKRAISRKEVDQLNQDANLDNLFGVFSASLLWSLLYLWRLSCALSSPISALKLVRSHEAASCQLMASEGLNR